MAIPTTAKNTVDITVRFDDPNINLFGEIDVKDVWSGVTTKNVVESYTAKNIAAHDTAFVILSRAASK